MFTVISDQIMVMRAALAPLRLTKWQIVMLVVKQIHRQISILQLFFLLSNTFTVIFGVFIVFYRLIFHPLAKYPGPTLAAVSEFWYIYHWLSGRYPWDLEELHNKYGPVVRVAPNELSFATAYGRDEIYGYAEKNSKPFPRINSSILDRFEVRKVLSQCFGARSLKESEAVVHENLDIFISGLGTQSTAVNINEWFEWLSLDIVSELVLGSPLGAVKQAAPRLQLNRLQDIYYRLPLLKVIQRLLPHWPFAWILQQLTFSKNLFLLQQASIQNFGGSAPHKKGHNVRNAFVNLLPERLSTESDDSHAAQANALIKVGSEHTSIFLTGVTYFLLTNSNKLRRVNEEIRSSFSDMNQIDNASLENLKYLAAVIEEGLRILPPSPFGVTCLSPGAVVAHNYVSEGTQLSTCTWAINHSPLNFTSPNSFIPERWLPPDHAGHNPRHSTDDVTASRPFSVGPRACAGIDLAYIEARIILAKLLWSFDWELSLCGVPDWDKKIRWHGAWKVPALMVRFVPVVRYEGSDAGESVELLG